MRMWCIDPSLLCQKHLIGEHGEIHKHKHNFIKKHKITKRIAPIVQIEPENMQKRHDELVLEMLKRGYKHNSPYEQPDLSHLIGKERYAQIDINISINDLINRCAECAKKINKNK